MTTRDMNNNEALEMLNRCKHEIMQMRETINQLKPKAEAYDNLVIVLNLLPRVSQGFGEDLVWTIQKRIDELTPKQEINPAPTLDNPVKAFRKSKQFSVDRENDE